MLWSEGPTGRGQSTLLKCILRNMLVLPGLHKDQAAEKLILSDVTHHNGCDVVCYLTLYPLRPDISMPETL